CLFGFFLGIQKEARRRKRRNTPDPAPQVPTSPPQNLCPTPHKGAPSNGGTTMLGSPPRQRQRWGRQSQSPHHPRLCVDLPCPLIAGPRKGGVQGVGDIGAGPAQPVLSLCAHPRCLFGFFLGIQKEARRRCGEIPPARHRRCQTLPPPQAPPETRAKLAIPTP